MTRRIAYLLPLLTGFALCITVIAGLHLEEDRYLQESRLDVFYKLSTIQSDFESGLTSRLHLADAVKAFITLNPDINQETFSILAHGLLNDVTGIRYLELAKDNAISHMYPDNGSSQMLGRNLLSDYPTEVRKLALKAWKTKQPQLSLPVSVMEGGEAIISATPVYLSADDSTDKKYWGMILMLIDTRILYREAGLAAKVPTLDLAMQEPSFGERGRLLYGEGAVFGMEPVVMHILIPDGYWQIGAVPVGGWASSPRRNVIVYGGGIAIASVTGLLLLAIHLLLSHIKEREKSRQLIESVKSIILRVDMDGKIIFANGYATDFYGYTLEELLGKPLVGTLIHESNLEGKSAARYVEQLLRNPSALPFNETISICKSGEMVWVAWANETMLNSAGKQNGLLCVGTDITDRKIMEEAVKLKERQYRLLAENVTDVIFGLDADMRYTFISPSDEKIRGFARYEVLGRPMTDFLARQSELALDDAVRKLKASLTSAVNPPSTSLDLEFACADSSSVWLETRLGLLLNEVGEIIGMQGVARDINERKLAQALRDDVERMTRHDLKTPLSAVVALPSEIRRRGEINEVQDTMLETIETAGETMLSLINRSLDLFKMECGTYRVRAADVDVLIVLERIKNDVQTIIRDKGISIGLEMENSDADRFKIVTEEDLFQAMLSNLILNALQASPNGGSLSVSLIRGNGITIHLRNKGEVPKNFREIFFDKYTTSKKSGTGLGTYSARLMARTLGGEIVLDTTTPGETCITVTLPA